MSKKILLFEGAGCAERGNVENCRLRTRFLNNKGKEIYLEITGIEVHKHSPNSYKRFTNVGIIDNCFENNCNEKSEYRELENQHFEYTKENIIDFINKSLDCNFKTMEILDDMEGYRVHGDNDNYNLMDNHIVNEKRTIARKEAFKKIDMDFREKLNEKYSVICLIGMDDNSITIKCYTSIQSLNKIGLTDNDRLKKIIVNY